MAQTVRPCQHAGMEQQIVEVQCQRCLIIARPSNTGASSWDCACGSSYVFRRCPACGVVSYVSASQQPAEPWSCTWCRASNHGYAAGNDPASATVAELAADMASHGLVFTRARPAPVRDSVRCPGCSAQVGPADQGYCPRCRICLTGPVAVELFWVAAALTWGRRGLTDRRGALLAELWRERDAALAAASQYPAAGGRQAAHLWHRCWPAPGRFGAARPARCLRQRLAWPGRLRRQLRLPSLIPLRPRSARPWLAAGRCRRGWWPTSC